MELLYPAALIAFLNFVSGLVLYFEGRRFRGAPEADLHSKSIALAYVPVSYLLGLILSLVSNPSLREEYIFLWFWAAVLFGPLLLLAFYYSRSLLGVFAVNQRFAVNRWRWACAAISAAVTLFAAVAYGGGALRPPF